MGQVSRAGVIPLSSSQDSVGPMAHSLKDALAVLSVIQGEDSDDVSTLNVNRTLDGIAPKPSLRIGALPASKFTVATQKLYAKQLQTLKDAGHTVVNVAVKDDLSTLYVDEYAILLYDFKAEINHYLSKTPTQWRHGRRHV